MPTPAREAQEASASSRPTSTEIASQIEGFEDDFKVGTKQTGRVHRSKVQLYLSSHQAAKSLVRDAPVIYKPCFIVLPLHLVYGTWRECLSLAVTTAHRSLVQEHIT